MHLVVYSKKDFLYVLDGLDLMVLTIRLFWFYFNSSSNILRNCHSFTRLLHPSFA